MNWPATRVVVTGGGGFLGSVVVTQLRERGCRDVVAPRSREYDLRDRDAIVRLYRQVRPQVVLHLAAVVGGIGANRANPGRFFYDNAIMGIQLMEYGRQFGVEKFVVAGYQADMDLAGRYIGMFYEEKGRGIMMKPGEKIKITTAPAAAPVEGAKGPPKAHAVEVLGTVSSPEQVKAAYKVGEWNDFVIIANGNHFQQFINGVPTADALDLDEPRFAKSGVIALQLHTGPPMTIQFKNIQLKTLP